MNSQMNSLPVERERSGYEIHPINNDDSIFVGRGVSFLIVSFKCVFEEAFSWGV